MRFGSFMAPFHPAGQNQTLALERDLDLVVHMDKLGFDEVWIGEHHSAGYEIITCPEIFLAVAAERTKHIRLGTGVISLPYHNPFTVAHRMTLLDHLTRGRVMFGFGPGQLASDASMLGVPIDEIRPRLVEGLDVVMRLLRGEVVTAKSEWFNLNEARLHLLPYSGDQLELAVTGTTSSNGARTAGTHGIGLLSVAATTPLGFSALRAHWSEYERSAKDNLRGPDRNRWRCVGAVHLAETTERAKRDVAYGIMPFAKYFNHVFPGGILPGDSVGEILAQNEESKVAIIGTPDEAVTRIRELQEESGGFGTFLMMSHEWADPEATKRSLSLFAQHVIPELDGRADAALRSFAWVDGSAEAFANASMGAMQKAGLIELDIEVPS